MSIFVKSLNAIQNCAECNFHDKYGSLEKVEPIVGNPCAASGQISVMLRFHYSSGKTKEFSGLLSDVDNLIGEGVLQ